MERLKSWFFYLTIFFAGLSVLVVEIEGSRVLAPFYGSTVFVWSSLLGVVMIAFAAGYVFGGRLADRYPTYHALWFIVLAAGLSAYVIPEYDHIVLPFTDQFGIRWGPLVASFLLFAPVLFFLATISPYAVKLRTQTLDNLGATAGNLYALATVGSLIGVFLTGFYLAPNFSFTIIFRLVGVGLIGLFVIWRIMHLTTKKQ